MTKLRNVEYRLGSFRCVFSISNFHLLHIIFGVLSQFKPGVSNPNPVWVKWTVFKIKEGCKSWINVIHTVTRLWAGLFLVWILAGTGIFLFSKMSSLSVGLRNPPIQWMLTLLSSGVKWPGCEADHSSPSGAPLKCLHSLYRYNCTFY